MKTFLIGLLLAFGLSAFGAGEPIQRNYFTTNTSAFFGAPPIVRSSNVLYASENGVPMDGVTSARAAIQALADRFPNGPVTIILDGPRFMWNDGKSVTYGSRMAFAGLLEGTRLVMGNTNNVPFFINVMNTNFSTTNVSFVNLIMDQRGTNQQNLMWTNSNACVASGTNVYTTPFIASGVKDVRVENVVFFNPTCYGSLCAYYSNLWFINVRWEWQNNLPTCGWDGFHMWSYGGDVHFRDCWINNNGDGGAFNPSEAQQFNAPQYWPTNLCRAELIDIDGLTVDAPTLGAVAGPVLNLQTSDNGWGSIGTVIAKNVHAIHTTHPIRTFGPRVGTVILQNWIIDHWDPIAGELLGTDFSGGTNTIIIDGFDFKTTATSSQTFAAITLGVTPLIRISGVSGDLRTMNGNGASMFSLGGDTNLMLVDNVVQLGGDAKFQNVGSDTPQPHVEVGAYVTTINVTNVLDNGLAVVLTNLFGSGVGPQSFKTNFILNQVYKNVWDKPIEVRANAVLTTSAAIGSAALSFKISNVITNVVSVPTTVAYPAVFIFTHPVPYAIVAPGGFWEFNDGSSGGANSATVSGGEIIR